MSTLAFLTAALLSNEAHWLLNRVRLTMNLGAKKPDCSGGPLLRSMVAEETRLLKRLVDEAAAC